MKIHLAILFAVIAICSAERRRLLVNQYRYDIPVHNTPLRPRYDLPITPGKPAEVYGVPFEYQVVQSAVQPPVQDARPVVSKYKYNIVAPVTSPVKFPQLVRYPVEEKTKTTLQIVPKENIVSTYKYKTESPEIQIVPSLPLGPYPAAIPATKVAEPVVSSYKFKIEPSAEQSLPLAPYPSSVVRPSLPSAPYPPALPISSKPVISQYNYKIEASVKPSLPLAPYPPAQPTVPVEKPPVPTVPVEKPPVVINKYNYAIKSSQLPSAPYPPAVYTPEVVKPVINKYKYNIESSVVPSLPPEVVKPVINKYKYNIESSVVPSLPSAPYPPAKPVPVVPKPNIINSYKFKIEPAVAPQPLPFVPLAPYPAAVPPTIVSEPTLTVSQVEKIKPVVNQYSYRIETPVKRVETYLPVKKIQIEESVKNVASKPAVFQYRYVAPYEEVRKVQESQVAIQKPHAVYGVPL
ncbi:hypothetical protein QE152_g26169 [Popillia japonica]|uniref:Uncharacterized protein n=1 Tax=Popillia japonica TaxID=7064 RepID=A0AAW1JZ72_POPJA